jgi:hypothetical protein
LGSPAISTGGIAGVLFNIAQDFVQLRKTEMIVSPAFNVQVVDCELISGKFKPGRQFLSRLSKH